MYSYCIRRYWRLYPLKWENAPSLRWELFQIDCRGAPQCSRSHRSPCFLTENTCGACEKGYVGSAGHLNQTCTAVQARALLNQQDHKRFAVWHESLESVPHSTPSSADSTEPYVYAEPTAPYISQCTPQHLTTTESYSTWNFFYCCGFSYCSQTQPIQCTACTYCVHMILTSYCLLVHTSMFASVNQNLSVKIFT